jgi:hypothetical protein
MLSADGGPNADWLAVESDAQRSTVTRQPTAAGIGLPLAVNLVVESATR